MRLMAVSLLLAIAGCAATPRERAEQARAEATAQDKLAATLAGLTPGESTTCLPALQSSQLAAYGPTLVYTVTRGLKYRNDTTGGCEGVARDDILITRSPQGRVCQGDIAQTVDRTSRFPTGSCSLGRFVPYHSS